MTDTITLPREVGEHLMWVLEECPMHGDWSERDCVALNALRTALAAEQPKPEPVAVFDEQMGQPVLLLGSPMLKDKQPLYTAPPEENETLRRDAERYRWLRGMIYDYRIIVAADTMLYGEALDAAIDAAMGDKT